ncbi:MAG: hypothetical protein LBE79_03145 [Tannerella sp.]|jgi:hypothetical protein|nr:hypothetical protein [Tannerella sp.]
MRILILIIILSFITAFFVLPTRFRMKIQRLIDIAISQSIYKQLSFLVITTGLAFGCLLLLIWIKYGHLKLHILDWIYTFINPGSFFSSAGKEPIDRTWAIITGITGMFFMSGLLISMISNIIERRVDKVKDGKAYYFFNNHLVIIGFHRMSIGLIRQFAKDKRYADCDIVLQTTQEASGVRHELSYRLDTQTGKKITVCSGNRASAEDLQRLNIHLCKEVFILGENDEFDNDSLDLECLKKIHAILSDTSRTSTTGRMIRCNVQFENQSTFTLFQRQDIDRLKDRIDFAPFNFYEMWAQKVFVDEEFESLGKDEHSGKIDYIPLDRGGITAESGKKVHIVIIGMTRMGIALGIQAAHLCHFPNFVTKGIKTRITFIADNADLEMNIMRGRHRHLFNETDIYYKEVSANIPSNDHSDHSQLSILNSQLGTFTDIEFEFIKAKVEYPEIQDYLAGLSCNDNLYLTIAVCFSFPPKSLAVGLYLPDKIYDNHIPVLVQQEIPFCTLDMLTKEGKFKNVKPFGMLDNCFDLSKADDRIPMMVNYVYCKGIPEAFPEAEIVAMWRELRTVLKWSNRYNANSFKMKIRSLGNFDADKPLDDKQIELMARVEHNRWNIEKLLMGYRTTTPKEKADIANDISLKNKLKINHFAHHDICDFDDLQADESGINASEYDRRISASLPLIINTCDRMQKSLIIANHKPETEN